MFSTCFVGGTIVRVENGVEDCVADAVVSLSLEETQLGTATSDGFGEFRISRLEANPAEVTLRVEVNGELVKTLNVAVKGSTYVGCIEV